MENMYLYDDKEFYLHINQPEKLVSFEPAIADPTKSLHLLTREWDPQTWQFGELREFQVPRTMKAVDFGRYLQSKFYPHIATEHMFAQKMTFIKTFYRSELAIRGWSNLISTVNTMLAACKLELSKDAVVIFVRDWSKTLREQLTEEEMAKYAN